MEKNKKQKHKTPCCWWGVICVQKTQLSSLSQDRDVNGIFLAKNHGCSCGYRWEHNTATSVYMHLEVSVWGLLVYSYFKRYREIRWYLCRRGSLHRLGGYSGCFGKNMVLTCWTTHHQHGDIFLLYFVARWNFFPWVKHQIGDMN